ncbi:MAG: plastocyanin/azurin family copper-binding protein [Nitrosopumilus sp.]|nr:plastocyanin/azurin family copper-binding protein [Nitrosopumilus sp.]
MATKKKLSLQVTTIFVITILIVGTTQFVFAKDDRTRLEAELINTLTGKDDGKAKFEQRSDRVTFSVEIEDQKSNSSFTIKVDGTSLGVFTTDNSGFADFNRDSRDGDNIPSITSGTLIELIDLSGNVVLYGKMIRIDGPIDSGSPTPPTENPPASTTSVIIPFGAKDKDVSEFYVPSSISISLSETVTWTNEDDTEHTVTSISDGIFNSGLFGTSQSFSHKFTADGTYQYFCQLHPWMTGTVIAGVGGDISTPTPPPSDTPFPPPEPLPPGSSQFTITIPSGAAEQTITEFYSPNSISVKISDSINWQNSDIGFHTVTSGKGSANGLFDSGLFGPGKTFSHQFTSTGTFDYFCAVHPWMAGKVIVEAGGDFFTPPTEPITPATTDPTLNSDPIPIPSPSPSNFTIAIPPGAALQTVDEFYSPQRLSINSADSITWQNKDDAFHTVTSTEGKLFDSGLFGPGKSFSFQFNNAGNFDYMCIVHPWMTGSVIVIAQEKLNQNEVSENLLSPLKQMKKGTNAKDVQCRTGFNLILKVSGDLGACVKPSSLSILIQRGWGQ